MLINFTLGNFLSFKEEKTLSLEAIETKEFEERVIEKNNHKILPSAVIYGANSSGKSNLIKGIKKFKELVSGSSKLNSLDKLDIIPFLLNPNYENEASFFEIELFIENDIYRYGFTVDNIRFYDEWLYRKKDGSGQEECFFVRTKDGIGVEKGFEEGRDLETRTRSNALFLSVVDSFNGEIAKNLISEFSNLLIISGIDHEYFYKTKTVFYDLFDDIKEGVDKLLEIFDLGFDKLEIPSDKDIANRIKAYTIHNKYDNEGNIIGNIQFNMMENESSGTNKLFDLISFVYSHLLNGHILIIDELDAKLHPILTRKLISLFNNKETNPRNAQLIFATHDTNLLSTKIFRRDQIWFTEKDRTEATDLYSLVEFEEPDGKKLMNGQSIEKNYINGRYGAIPYIRD